MTTTTAHPGHHVSVKNAGLALAGAALAVAAGFGVAGLVLDEDVLPAPAGEGFTDPWGDPRYDPNGYGGTDRETRAFQHRR